MKLLLFNCIVVLSHIGQAQTLRYEGILNDTSIDPDFDKGHEAISTSIKENLAHLNLYEYAHALPELYPLVENGVIEAQQWKYFVDSLELEVIKHQNGSIVPYWAVDYTGLIPYQSQFFIATIDRNIKLNEKYPKAYKILKANTSSMDGLDTNVNILIRCLFSVKWLVKLIFGFSFSLKTVGLFRKLLKIMRSTFHGLEL